MQFSAILTVLVAGAVTAASVIPNGHVHVVDAADYMANGLANATVVKRNLALELTKRTPGNVYFCTDINFAGTCVYITGAFSTGCVELGPDLDNLVSAVGPDEGQVCTLYENHGCPLSIPIGFSRVTVAFPGVANLGQPFPRDGPSGGPLTTYNDRVSSYSCRF
ncbi:Short chain dehydrogenase [Mycena kentingensis (nom. inval.)]|nr:Short chain dehydrogenase [Mycena kentingensis (nom. inval.)]